MFKDMQSTFKTKSHTSEIVNDILIINLNNSPVLSIKNRLKKVNLINN